MSLTIGMKSSFLDSARLMFLKTADIVFHSDIFSGRAKSLMNLFVTTEGD